MYTLKRKKKNTDYWIEMMKASDLRIIDEEIEWHSKIFPKMFTYLIFQ